MLVDGSVTSPDGTAMLSKGTYVAALVRAMSVLMSIHYAYPLTWSSLHSKGLRIWV